MMNGKQAPKVEITDKGGPTERERYSHPAFGEISVSKSTLGGGGMELFGSDLHHRSVITVTISTAYLDRHLSRDWVHSDRQVMSFQMSEAQWAAFVSSQGGAGVPITLQTRAPEGTPLELMPGIESPETMTEQFDREIRESCEGYLAQAKELTERIEQALADGKANKGMLKELHDLSRSISNGMPNTMAFVQKQMTGAMEKLVTSGKIEMEAFVNDMAMRTGIAALRYQSPTMLIDQPTDIEPPSDLPATGAALVDAFIRGNSLNNNYGWELTRLMIADWADELEAGGFTVQQIEETAAWNAKYYPGIAPTLERITFAATKLKETGELPIRMNFR